MRIKTLIVDDEPLARAMIHELLKNHHEIEVLAECKTGAEAVDAIQQLRPDLVFLDVQMPEINGFAVLEHLEDSERPEVVFVTAHDKYAIAAFEINALDYLLKPFTPDRFERAVERAVHDLKFLQKREDTQKKLADLLTGLAAAGPSSGTKSAASERLVVRDSGRIVFLKTREIDYIEAARDYACIHAGGKTYVIHETMNHLESTLDSDRFLRIHRLTIINLNLVVGIETDPSGESFAVLQGHRLAKVSRSCRERLLQKMGAV